MKTLRLILGDQLNPRHSWFETKNDNVLYVMMEIRPETDYVKHHLQKLLGVLGGMREFADHLREKNHQIEYIKITDNKNRHSFEENLKPLIQKYRIVKFEYQEPDEYRVDRELQKTSENLGIRSEMVSSGHFLTDRIFLKEFFGDKTYLMENFYRHMRKKHNVLMDQEQPQGGKWNFDMKNRKKYDGKIPLPRPLEFKNDLRDLFSDLKSAGIEWFGKAEPSKFPYPVNRQQALQLLDHFTEKLLPHFGTYQDALTNKSETLFHSRFSFALNTKMLHPLELIRKAESQWERITPDYGPQQIEGFIRQILGWREYVRGIYWAEMPGYEKLNFFGNKNNLPEFYWSGKTKMNCMSLSIGQSLDKAYAHHIQRLMITGNFALLAGVNPDEVDNWYLGIYIDAFQWVEITNTRGMSQFADGGIMATKPYVSSANYINKMSNYCKGCFYDPKKRSGTRACPFNSLYWNFFEQHRDKLAKNHRLGMIYRILDRMSADEKSVILEQAEEYLKNIGKL